MGEDRNPSKIMMPPENFKFPFPPYDIQKNFMTNLFTTIEESKLGIFESPTGTGKTLSLMSGSLTWLLAHETREKQRLQHEAKAASLEVDGDSVDDWLTAQTSKLKEKEAGRLAKLKLQRLTLWEEKIQGFVARKQKLKLDLNADSNPVKKWTSKAVKSDPAPEESMMSVGTQSSLDTNYNLRDPEDLLLSGVSKREASPEPEEEEEKYIPPKIFFCSRTHSQLAQVAHEVMKLDLGIRVVTLASRLNYCIHPDVMNAHPQDINDKCKEMRESSSRAEPTAVPNPAKKPRMTKSGKEKSEKKGGCRFLDPRAMELLQLTAMTEIMDIEALVKTSKEVGACPYYTSRAALGDAQLVLLPYNTLLHEATRTASGIDLRGNVVIIDEAHNLLDTIASIHSVELSGTQLDQCLLQLKAYDQRYRCKLAAAKVLLFSQLMFAVKTFQELLGSKPSKEGSEQSEVMSLDEFVSRTGMDCLKPLDLVKFADETQLAAKIRSCAMTFNPNTTDKTSTRPENLKEFLSKLAKPEAPEPVDVSGSCTSAAPSPMGTPLLVVQAFLQKLMTPCKDAAVVVRYGSEPNQRSLKIIRLNPGSAFKDIVQDARSVIVAGGTMQPMSDFTQQLFQTVPPEKIQIFSCSHVVPPDHVLPIAVPCGPSNLKFNFTFQHRNSDVMVHELGRCLVNLCRVVPDGMVAFFPSYSYEQLVVQKWTKSGILQQIEAKKKIFREPKTTSDVDTVLHLFGSHIKKCSTNPGSVNQQNGAILFSVVGGKLSEGINFSDELGRCVVVVGMPYANLHSPELKSRMSYLDNNLPSPAGGPSAGQAYYEEMCMKAVNQCIGRAVRHRADYAAMLLLDSRYTQHSVQQALPAWIKGRLQTFSGFGPICATLTKFYRTMASKRDK